MTQVPLLCHKAHSLEEWDLGPIHVLGQAYIPENRWEGVPQVGESVSSTPHTGHPPPTLRPVYSPCLSLGQRANSGHSSHFQSRNKMGVMTALLEEGNALALPRNPAGGGTNSPH